MRQLTESERVARDVAKSAGYVPYLADSLEHYIFDMGFITGLDTNAAQLAALEAENERLKAALNLNQIQLDTGEQK